MKCLLLSSYSSTEHYFAKWCDDIRTPVSVSLEGCVFTYTTIVLDVNKESFYYSVYIYCSNYCGKSSRQTNSIFVLCFYFILYCPQNFNINTPFPFFQGYLTEFSTMLIINYIVQFKHPIHLPQRCLLYHHPQHDE